MTKQETVEEEKPVKKERYSLVEVPTQTGIFIRDNEQEEILDDKFVLVTILNKINNIEKTL